jgi:transcriptional regulator GlxA family with amidase domain
MGIASVWRDNQAMKATKTESQAKPCIVAMLAIEGALSSSLTGPLDAFRVANALYARIHPGAHHAPFALHLISADGAREVRTAGGFTLSGLTAADAITPDILLIPGMEYRSHSELLERVQINAAALLLIQRMFAANVQIAASCSGTFFIAASGILDGRAATTSWWLAATFRSQFPRVKLDAGQLVVNAGNITTAGAVTAMFSLVLKFVEQYAGPELAQNTARILLIDPTRQSQAPFVSEALIQHPRSAFSELLEPYLQAHLHTDLTVESLAAHLNVSTRSCLRKFQQIYQQSPQSYIQQLRVDRAKALLETTKLSFEEICEACGYQDAASFRKLFKRIAELTPAEYQKRFRLRGP